MSEPVSSLYLNFNYSQSDLLYIVNACIYLAHPMSSVALGVRVGRGGGEGGLKHYIAMG